MPRRGSSCSADGRRSTACPPRVLHRLLVGAIAVLVGLASFVVSAGPTGAESPTDVAEQLAIDGVFVAPGRDDIDEAAIAAAIQRSRARGLRLVVVAPVDPQPSPQAFARRILEASDADAALVFPTEGGLASHVIEEFESAGLRALAAGRSKAEPADVVDAFTDELLAERTGGLPPIIGQVLRFVLLLAVILGGAVVLEQLLRRMFRRTPTNA